jgi:transposase-like protein
MNMLQEIYITCPYCGEHITVLADGSVEEQRYIEDCQVCCRPMDILVNVSQDGRCQVEARAEND